MATNEKTVAVTVGSAWSALDNKIRQAKGAIPASFYCDEVQAIIEAAREEGAKNMRERAALTVRPKTHAAICKCDQCKLAPRAAGRIRALSTKGT